MPSQLRRYGPVFLETFTFRAAPAVQPLLDGIETLKEVYRVGARRVPNDAPVAFVRRRWARFVFADGGIDRRYYELCAMSEFESALRAGDIWVVGSGQHRDFEDYLLSADDTRRHTGCSLLRHDILRRNIDLLSADRNSIAPRPSGRGRTH
jgi:hypothetical protein